MVQAFHVAVGLEVQATADKVWGALVDYHDRHRRILPSAFQDFVIESGGQGAGTVLRCTLVAMGRRIPLRMTVSEPTPGLVLRESLDDGTVTEFILEPNAAGTRVTIATVWPRKPGLKGWLEMRGTQRFARRLYAQELENLAIMLAFA